MSEDEKEIMMMLHKQQHEEEEVWNTHSYLDIQENHQSLRYERLIAIQRAESDDDMHQPTQE